jgi:hypothetical protein
MPRRVNVGITDITNGQRQVLKFEVTVSGDAAHRLPLRKATESISGWRSQDKRVSDDRPRASSLDSDDVSYLLEHANRCTEPHHEYLFICCRA